ncbi:MAG: SBBP repeat-containing protein [Chloroflexota bacterium]
MPAYYQVVYPDAWAGIDVLYERGARGLKSSYMVAAGADPGQIRIDWKGAEATVDESGELHLLTPIGTLSESAPRAWQEHAGVRHSVAAAWISYDDDSDGHVWGFGLGLYDPSLPLLIDPDLTYATFMGGSGRDVAQALALDTNGDAFVAGFTESFETSFPDGDGFGSITGFDQSHNGGTDAFVAKLSPTGAAWAYVTFLGGSGDDVAYALGVDAAGAAFVAGATDSTQTSFPDGDPNNDDLMGAPGFDQTHNGGFDGFIAKITPAGTALDYATYLGGSGDEQVSAMSMDTTGAAYVAGLTRSTQTSFPDGDLDNDDLMGVLGFDQTHNGSTDSFVAKLTPSGTGLAYATYVGGSGDDIAHALAVDANGAAYISGSTASIQTSFPDGDGFGPIPGFDQSHNGGTDAFVAKLTPAGTGLTYATYLGGSGDDVAYALVVDTNGAAYVAGPTNSTQTSFPDGDGFGPIPGFDQSHNGGADAFVAKLTPAGTAWVYATFLGGSGDDIAYALAVDTNGAAYVAGRTVSTQSSFPDGDGFGPIPGFDQVHNGAFDAFVTVLTSAGTSLAYATYLGGSGNDLAFALAVDANGAAYVAGWTDSTQTSFPDGDPNNDDLMGVPGIDQTFNGSFSDAYVVKIVSPTATATPTLTPTPTRTFTPTATRTLTPTSTPTLSPTRAPVGVAVDVATPAPGMSGPGPILARLSAATGCGAIKQIQLHSSANAVGSSTAVIDISGGPSGLQGTQTYTPPAGTVQLTLIIRRNQPGAITIPVTVTDGCGAWPTFVGAGAGVP